MRSPLALRAPQPAQAEEPLLARAAVRPARREPLPLGEVGPVRGPALQPLHSSAPLAPRRRGLPAATLAA